MRIPRWRLIISATLTLAIIVLAYQNRAQLAESFALLERAKPVWLAAAFGLELLGFYVSSRVYAPALRSLGHHVGALRLWAMTLVAIVLSQSFPAGGVASYAFLVHAFRRRGIPGGHAALLASLEALSYATAMLLLFFFSLFYIMFQGQAAGWPSLIAAAVAVLAITIAVFLVTRNQVTIVAWLLHIKNGANRLLRQQWSDAPVHRLVTDLARGRALIAEQPGEVGLLICLQLLALTCHSLAMLAVLSSLGATTSPLVVMAAYGIALVSSTFNVLPGGGGTVETAIVVALQSLGVGNAAISAAVIFRLLNFWLMAPIAFVGYRWIMHGKQHSIESTVVEEA